MYGSLAVGGLNILWAMKHIGLGKSIRNLHISEVVIFEKKIINLPGTESTIKLVLTNWRFLLSHTWHSRLINFLGGVEWNCYDNEIPKS